MRMAFLTEQHNQTISPVTVYIYAIASSVAHLMMFLLPYHGSSRQRSRLQRSQSGI